MTPHALAMTSNVRLLDWVGEVARLTRASEVAWCEGSSVERRQMVDAAASAGVLLCESKRPSYVHELSRARVRGMETMKFVCTPTRAEAGSSNHWMAPRAARSRMESLLAGSLKSSTLYVVPHILPEPHPTPGKVSIELTNSLHGILSMGVASQMGKAALELLGDHRSFRRGFHATLSSAPRRLLVCHFLEDDMVWSVRW